MPEKRGKGLPSEPDDPTSDPSLSDSQLERIRLRQRWELASVLNFLHVFLSLVHSDLEISAEEIETGLITPNDALARLHIALLKGIPPVNKNISCPDAWVTIVCKKLATWWPWVAEGDNPLKADHGEEILRYKALDPTTRMLILKALCEVRAAQDDVLRYVTDELKKGTNVNLFRKERIGGNGNGITYWYDGDSVIGHRLYREIDKVDSQRKSKGKGHATQPAINSQWETLATNLEEFQEISDNLSSSKNMGEVSIGEIIKIEIVPVLEQVQKKKERALKRQQRQALELDVFLNSHVGTIRPRRERSTVSYTFDEYDRSINEAIQILKESKVTGSHKDNSKQVDQMPGQKGFNGSENFPDEVHDYLPEVEDDYRSNIGDDDDDAEDDDYDEKDEDRNESNGIDDGDDNDDSVSSDEEKGDPPRRTHSGDDQNKKGLKAKVVVGVRRSQRINQENFDAYRADSKGHAEMKKRLRQRPTRNNADFSTQIVSDSEDNLSEDDKQTEEVSDTEGEDSAASSEGLQTDSGDAGDE